MRQEIWEKEVYVLTEVSGTKSNDLESTQRDKQTHGAWLCPEEFLQQTRRVRDSELLRYWLTWHLDCDWYSVERPSAKASDSLFLFSFLFQGGLFNSLFTHITLAYPNNSLWTWIILRHCGVIQSPQLFPRLVWLAFNTIWKPLRMCRVISAFNFSYAWREGSSICLHWPVFKIGV